MIYVLRHELQGLIIAIWAVGLLNFLAIVASIVVTYRGYSRRPSAPASGTATAPPPRPSPSSIGPNRQPAHKALSQLKVAIGAFTDTTSGLLLTSIAGFVFGIGSLTIASWIMQWAT